MNSLISTASVIFAGLAVGLAFTLLGLVFVKAMLCILHWGLVFVKALLWILHDLF